MTVPQETSEDAAPSGPWGLRILPRVTLGAHPHNQDGVDSSSPAVKVLHHFIGSWKVRGGWRKTGVLQSALQKLASLGGKGSPSFSSDELQELPVDMFPVSAAVPSHAKTPFDVMVHLAGTDVASWGGDQSATISKYGSWQAGIDPWVTPSVGDVVVRGLGGNAKPSVFVDVGADIGFFTLAAASRGHQVHAIELQKPNLEVLRESVRRNGFSELVKVHPAAVGNSTTTLCVDPQHLSRNDLREVLRGYPSARLERAHAGEEREGGCPLNYQRQTLDSLLPPGLAVRMLRLAVDGWEQDVLDGASALFSEAAPPFVLVEFSPAKFHSVGHIRAVDFLKVMHDRGYTDISHAGPACGRRWAKVVRSRKHAEYKSIPEPTWCTLKPESFSKLLSGMKKSNNVPENIMFHRPSPSPADGPAAGGG